MLVKHPGNSFLLCMLVEILQLVHEISSLQEVFYKKVFSKTSQNSQVNARSSHPEVFSERGVLLNFGKFTEKHICRSLFFNKVAGWKPFLRTPILKNICEQVLKHQCRSLSLIKLQALRVEGYTSTGISL